MLDGAYKPARTLWTSGLPDCHWPIYSSLIPRAMALSTHRLNPRAYVYISSILFCPGRVLVKTFLLAGSPLAKWFNQLFACIENSGRRIFRRGPGSLGSRSRSPYACAVRNAALIVHATLRAQAPLLCRCSQRKGRPAYGIAPRRCARTAAVSVACQCAELPTHNQVNSLSPRLHSSRLLK